MTDRARKRPVGGPIDTGGGPVTTTPGQKPLPELDLVVCPGCGADEPVVDLKRRTRGRGWVCVDDCGMELEQGRPPTLAELMTDPEGFGEWTDVDISAFVHKIVVLMAVSANRLNPGAAQTLGFLLIQRHPGLNRTLMPELMRRNAANR